MLNLVTGTPGASKTAFVVTQLVKLERSNYINIRKNKLIYEHNLEKFKQFRDEFSYYEYEVGSGNELKKIIEPLAPDYFDFLAQEFLDLRPDDYFKKTTRYNEIVERIEDLNGSQGFQYFQPVRTIYTNIKALKIDYTRALLTDWRDAPDGAVHVVDEVQLVAPYSDKKSNDAIINELTIHRHRGFDFYFITQAPRFLHPVVKDLIGCHYHITRPFGWTPKVYQYGAARDNPNAMVNKFNYENKFTFKPSASIFKLYKSTTINTAQKRIPRFIWVIGAIVITFVGLFIHFASKDNVIYDQVSGKKPVQATGENKSTTITPELQSKINLCMKDFNWTAEQCREAFDKDYLQAKQKEQEKTSTNTIEKIVANYNPSKPFEAMPVQYEVTAKPVFSGCMKKGNKYVAYSQQGTILPDVSQDDCRRVVENGERPFNYFQQPQQQLQAQQQPQQQQKLTSLDAEFLAKYQQAKAEGLI